MERLALWILMLGFMLACGLLGDAGHSGAAFACFVCSGATAIGLIVEYDRA